MMRSFSGPPRRPVSNTWGRVRRGAAAVELAFVAPFLALLLMGMFELGRAIMAKETLCNAARKGCRTGIIHQYGNLDIYNDAVNILRDNGYSASQFNPPPPVSPVPPGNYVGSIAVTVTDPNGNSLADALDAPPGSKVTVQVSVPVSSVLWTGAFFLTNTTIESDVMVMMKQ